MRNDDRVMQLLIILDRLIKRRFAAICRGTVASRLDMKIGALINDLRIAEGKTHG